MRILILSCNTGEGHNSCAKALKEVFDEKGHHCVIEDALSFVSKSAETLIPKGHVFIYRHLPGVFRVGYQYTEKHPGTYFEDSEIYNYLSRGKQRLADYIGAGAFDIVISTHVIGGILVTEARKIYSGRFYTAFVGTDYTCSPSTEASDLDVYFIPDEGLRHEFVEYGIPTERLVAGGIPVRQMFFRSTDKESAKRAEGIDPGHRHLLVMSGSMGCGPIESLVSLLARSLREDEELTVVCGTNERMRKKLELLHRGSSNVHIRGFVTDISSLMDSADLYLTKPGGISVTEAKHKRLPMAFVDAVAGCEEYNRRFFVENGCAVSEKDVHSLNDTCVSLLRDDAALSRMAKCFEALDMKNSAQFICEYLSSIG